MTSIKTYRAAGIIASLAVKAPCVAVTDANITLNGEQTVNGVAVVDGDRVLVKDQTDSGDNGIYNVSSGNWQRAADFDGNRDVTNGTLVVVAGSPLVGVYQLTATNPVTVGTTALTFSLLSAINVAGNLASTLNGLGASLVAIEDAAGNFTATDVEAALAEIFGKIPTFASGSFTPTFDGFSVDPTPTTVRWVRQGAIVVVQLDFGTGTSDDDVFAITNVPAAIQAGVAQQMTINNLIDNGTNGPGTIHTSTLVPASWFFGWNHSLTGFTASGAKGVGPGNPTFSYFTTDIS